MQRNFKNMVTMSVMVLSAVHTSHSFAAGKGAGPSAAGQSSFSVNSNHGFQSLSSNSFRSTPAFKSFNSNLSTSTLKANSLSHLSSSALHQVQIHNNAIQPLTGKTPLKLNVGKNLQNL